MSRIRLLQIGSCRENLINNIEKKLNNGLGLSYDEMVYRYGKMLYFESDFIHKYLGEFGVESKIIYTNVELFQRTWIGKETNISMHDIMLAQVDDFKPNVVYFSRSFTKREVEDIRSVLNGNVLFIAFNFSILDESVIEQLKLMDTVLTGSRENVQRMKQSGINAVLWRHAFETSILSDFDDEKRKNGVLFTGSIDDATYIHKGRLEAMCTLVESGIPMQFYGNKVSDERRLKKRIASILPGTNAWNRKRMINMIEQYRHTAVFGHEYYKVIFEHTVNLNVHSPINGNGAGNMRMFEATGLGVCLLTDDRPENEDIFDTKKEIVTYNGYGDLVEKAKWLINNPDDARKIALAGQERTLRDYTYQKKAARLVGYIREYIK